MLTFNLFQNVLKMAEIGLISDHTMLLKHKWSHLGFMRVLKQWSWALKHMSREDLNFSLCIIFTHFLLREINAVLRASIVLTQLSLSLWQCVFTSSGAKVREGSLHVSHSAVAPIIDELNFLRSNHSDVIEAEEEAKIALERAAKNHAQLKEKIEKQRTINDNYQKQVEELQEELIHLQSNMSALGEKELLFSKRS